MIQIETYSDQIIKPKILETQHSKSKKTQIRLMQDSILKNLGLKINIGQIKNECQKLSI